MPNALRVALAIFAVWRITHLAAREDGPWDLLRGARAALARLGGRRVASCFYCLSVWIALPFAWFVRGSTVERLVAWWAISGAAILLERATAPAVIEIEDERGGMLRADDGPADHQPG